MEIVQALGASPLGSSLHKCRRQLEADAARACSADASCGELCSLYSALVVLESCCNELRKDTVGAVCAKLEGCVHDGDLPTHQELAALSACCIRAGQPLPTCMAHAQKAIGVEQGKTPADVSSSVFTMQHVPIQDIDDQAPFNLASKWEDIWDSFLEDEERGGCYGHDNGHQEQA